MKMKITSGMYFASLMLLSPMLSAELCELDPVKLQSATESRSEQGIQANFQINPTLHFIKDGNAYRLKSESEVTITNMQDVFTRSVGRHMPNSNCHHRYHPHSYSVAGSNNSIVGTFVVRYQKWSCNQVPYPCFYDWKWKTCHKDTKTKLYQKTVTVNNYMYPRITGGNLTIDTRSDIHADGGLSDNLGSLGKIFTPIDAVVNHIAENAIKIPATNLNLGSLASEFSDTIDMRMIPKSVRVLNGNPVRMVVTSESDRKVRAGSACRIRQLALEKQGINLVEMVKVKGGTFEFGKEPGSSGQILHGGFNFGDSAGSQSETVTVGDFYIAPYEVTKKEWVSVMRTLSDQYVESEPVHGITWYQAITFANKLSVLHGYRPYYDIHGSTVTENKSANGYRLPTIFEWEYAAIGGNKSKDYRYSGSNTLHEIAWFGENSGKKIQPVGRKRPNELGLYDMSGNVNEWCWESEADYMRKNPNANPNYKGDSGRRYARGGAYSNHSGALALKTLYNYRSEQVINTIGLRLVRNAS